ncbi:hypothetical protein [Hansschlegelia sp. KR7-227]|uniref:hypothetical protein n=1 Tax=Hansschlegelia sp. KR7-227 TaxID=3400914 RepID=UPI003BFC1107
MANFSTFHSFSPLTLSFKSLLRGFIYDETSTAFHVAGPRGDDGVQQTLHTYGSNFTYTPLNNQGTVEPKSGTLNGFSVLDYDTIAGKYSDNLYVANISVKIEKIVSVASTKDPFDDYALVKTIFGKNDVFNGSDVVRDENRKIINTGDDFLQSFNGNDTLYGNGGADTLDGGSGRDTSSYEFAGGRVHADLRGELAGVGEAKGDVFVSIENVIGSRYADAIHGDDASNYLNGMLGKDTLYGHGGADKFDFTTAIKTTSADVIGDFEHGVDDIRLEGDIFKDIGFGRGGAMQAKHFYTGTAAHDANDRIIYDRASGKLFYDADGDTAGGVKAVQFATLLKVDGVAPELSQTDFLII